MFVDENDIPIGTGSRQIAWQRGYFTRNIRVIIRDESNRFLCQKRSLHKDSYPGMWTVAASGHVDDGETWDDAAKRETLEEIGISINVKSVGQFTFKDDIGNKKIRQIVHVYEASVDSLTQFVTDQDEVDKVEWFHLDELKSLIAKDSSQFTPSLIEVVKVYY